MAGVAVCLSAPDEPLQRRCSAHDARLSQPLNIPPCGDSCGDLPDDRRAIGRLRRVSSGGLRSLSQLSLGALVGPATSTCATAIVPLSSKPAARAGCMIRSATASANAVAPGNPGQRCPMPSRPFSQQPATIASQQSVPRLILLDERYRSPLTKSLAVRMPASARRFLGLVA